MKDAKICSWIYGLMRYGIS